MANRIILNETSYHGAGSRVQVAAEIKRRGLKKVFIFTDNNPTRLAASTFNDVSTGGNPRPTSVADIEDLYSKTF